MKLLRLILSIVTIMFTTNAFAKEVYGSQVDSPLNIQVLLAKNVTEALLEAKGGYIIIDPLTGNKVTSSFLGKRFVIRASNSGIKWGEEFPGIHQVYVMPKDKSSSLLLNGIEYDGAIAVFQVKDKINIVNDVDIECYLKATLSTQFPYPLENEVMASIAIAARTTAYSHVKRNSDAFWHISYDDANYFGSAIVQPESHISSAVEKTKHLILVHSKDGQNRPFAAYWTENSAGKTISFQNFYRKDWWAPDVGVEAKHAQLVRDESKWSYTISKKELAQKLDMSNISEINLYTDSFSNKTYALKIKDKEVSKDLDFISFQNILGKDAVKSSDIRVLLKQNEIVFSGFGKGHGVGICIHSATQMAQNGANAAKILSKFFPETYILNISATKKAAR
jgi:stage II sporulation protein D